MQRLRIKRPSASMTVAFVALLAALTGTSVALPGKNTVTSGDIKNSQVKTADIRNNGIRGRDIKRNTVKGSDVDEKSLGTVPVAGSSAFDEKATVVGLGAAFVPVASANITVPAAGSRVIATGSAELINGNVGACRILLSGVVSLEYEATLTAANQQSIAVTFARTLPAGVHAVQLQCSAIAGAVAKEDASVAAWSVGA